MSLANLSPGDLDADVVVSVDQSFCMARDFV